MRFGFNEGGDASAIWSPDGRKIAFASIRNGPCEIFLKDANSAAPEELFLKSAENKYPESWSPDGRVLLYSALRPETGYDLWTVPLDGDHKPTPFVQSVYNENDAAFSPDGRWVAYVSDLSGVPEVYVRPYSASDKSGGQWMIWNGGGSEPRWRRDGKELLYLAGQKLMSADVFARGSQFRASRPKPLFDVAFVPGTFGPPRNWDISPDGNKFLVKTATRSVALPIHVLLNWTAAWVVSCGGFRRRAQSFNRAGFVAG